MQDIEKTIQSQYASSPRICAIIHGLNELIRIDKSSSLMYEKYFNPLTATGISLDVWGRIVGIERGVEVVDADFFGFLGQEMQGFDNASFFIENQSNIYEFSDKAYRLLILIKSAINISRIDAKTINSLLKQIFENRSVYVLEIKTMHIRYVFEFELEDYERAIIEEIKLLPRPCGVGFEYYEIIADESFGFEGSQLHNFDNGVFALQDIKQITLN